MYDIEQLNAFIVPELKEIAEKFSVKGFKRMAKMDLVHAILDAQADKEPEAGVAAKEKPEVRKNTKRPLKKQEESNSSNKTDKKPSSSDKNEKGSSEESSSRENNKRQRNDRRKKNDNEQGRGRGHSNNSESKGQQNDRKPPKKEYVFDVKVDGCIAGEGVLELMNEGYGFLR